MTTSLRGATGVLQDSVDELPIFVPFADATECPEFFNKLDDSAVIVGGASIFPVFATSAFGMELWLNEAVSSTIISLSADWCADVVECDVDLQLCSS